MRKTTIFPGLLLLVLTSASIAQPTTIGVYTWADIMDFSVIDAFEAETGLRVDYQTYRHREALEARLARPLADLDLLMLPDDLLARLARQGQLQALDEQELENWHHLHPTLLAATEALDPAPRHGVPFFWGVSGLLMDSQAVGQRLPEALLDSLALLLDPVQQGALADCGLWLPDSASEVIPMVLGYLGEDRGSGDPAALARVRQHLSALWPQLAGVHSLEPLDRLASGEACLTLSWSDGALQAQETALRAHQNPADFRIPREGARLWLDMLAIPASAPHPDAARRLVDYLLRPAVSAQVANYASLAPANRSSWPDLLEEIRHNPVILAPEPPGGFYTVNPEPATRERWEKLWRALRIGP